MAVGKGSLWLQFPSIFFGETGMRVPMFFCAARFNQVVSHPAVMLLFLLMDALC
jgi:hypothetical protein